MATAAPDRAVALTRVHRVARRLPPGGRSSAGMERDEIDTDDYDRHGVVRCKHCGGPCDQLADGLGLYFARRKPRLRVKRQLGLTPACKSTVQSIACEKEWRMLIPMSRTSPTYHALAKAGKNKEHGFRHWRDRYTVAGSDIDNRPKRAGLAWQQLRAQVVLLLELFQLSLRHGWIGSHRRRNKRTAEKLYPGNRLERMLGRRRRDELDLPPGKYAVAAGFAKPPP